MVDLPAGLLTRVAAAPKRVALAATDENRKCAMIASFPTSGTLRRCLPQQPPPWRGRLAEGVHLPAGPEAGAAAAPWLTSITIA